MNIEKPNKKADKWWHQTTYVDQQTGEILTKKEVQTNYIIVKKHKSYEYFKQYNWRKNIGETIGIIKHTNECTREGKQQSFW